MNGDAPKPEGPAGGEAGDHCTKGIWDAGWMVGLAEGKEIGAAAMRERAAKALCEACAGKWRHISPTAISTTSGSWHRVEDGTAAECHASAIHALPLSVADGPAPAKEAHMGTACADHALAGGFRYDCARCRRVSASPPTAEEGVDYTKVIRPDCERVAQERAALLACRDAARDLYDAVRAAWPTNGITEAMTGLVRADLAVKRVLVQP